MSTTKVRKPRPRRMLDGFPPDTRLVIAEVTWDDYERFVDSIDEGEICRVAYDGKDIEMMTLGPWHESEKSLLEAFIADRRWTSLQQFIAASNGEGRMNMKTRSSVSRWALRPGSERN